MVKRLNWNSIQASSDGDFTPLPAGGYVVRVVDMVDNEKKEYVDLIWDIAEGEHKGRYSDDWGKKHPYVHHVVLSYKDTALGMLKGRLETIGKSNTGFDPFAAWDAGRLDMFRGRLLGINLQEEEYKTRDDKVKTRLNVCQVLTVDDVHTGNFRVRAKKTLDESDQPTSSPTISAPVAEYDDFDEDDVPFD